MLIDLSEKLSAGHLKPLASATVTYDTYCVNNKNKPSLGRVCD